MDNRRPLIVRALAVTVVLAAVFGGYELGAQNGRASSLYIAQGVANPAVQMPTSVRMPGSGIQTSIYAHGTPTQVQEASGPEPSLLMEPMAYNAPQQGLSGVRALAWGSIVAGVVMTLSALYRLVARPSQTVTHEPFVACAVSGSTVELPDWQDQYTYLKASGLKSVSGKEALALSQRPFFGAKILDTRIPVQYENSHPAGAVSAPLFLPLVERSFADTLKKLTLASLAVDATELNQDFIAECEKAGLKKSDTIIVTCTLGGSMDNVLRRKGKPDTMASGAKAYGTESRSLKACYLLKQAGFKNVVHLDGGLNQWFSEGLPCEGLAE